MLRQDFLISNGRLEEASQLLKQSIGKEPRNEDAFNLLGWYTKITTFIGSLSYVQNCFSDQFYLPVSTK